MLRRKIILLFPLVFLFISLQNTLGQGVIDNQRSILYKNEKTFGIFLNSNGFGGDFTYADRINARNHRLYQVEMLYLKHPKEVKISNGIYTNRSFVFGKTNSFYELRGQWGKQTEIYRKNDANGISIRYFYSIGPTIGFLKPIYYEVIVPSKDNSGFIPTEIQKFSPSIHQTTIFGKASFFEGFDEISIIPGASAKFGFSFEYSKENKSLGAIEFGAGFDIFPKEIPIMANELIQFFFLNLYAGYRWGKAIDISDAAIAKRERESRKANKTSRKVKKEKRKAARQQDDF